MRRFVVTCVAACGLVFEFARPFTCVMPAIGVWSACAAGFVTRAILQPPAHAVFDGAALGQVLVVGACAALLNAASNTLNQIFDVDIDAVNKPMRPLPSRRLSIAAAWAITLAFFSLALTPTWFIVSSVAPSASERVAAPFGAHACFWTFFGITACTVVYSVPPVRTKQHWLASNVTIAVARGCLLKVAGWAVFARVDTAEPWFIGGVFALFLLFAASTKDLADIAGDAQHNCVTLPLRFGATRAIVLMAASFTLPWLLLPVGAWTGVLSGNRIALSCLGCLLCAYGAYTAHLMWLERTQLDAVVRAAQSAPLTFDALTNKAAAPIDDVPPPPLFDENHSTWRHMYALMMSAQLGLAACYLAQLA